jgi:integrase
LLLAACVSSGPLSERDAARLATRTWDGATDEVFDATWLTLERRGFSITDDDRLAGTLQAQREGRTWNVDVAALGNSQRVTLTPSSPVSRAELSAMLDALEEGTAKLLHAWHDPPEWKFDGRRNLLSISGFAVSPPLEWAWLDFDLSRRVVTVQQSRTRNVRNATMVVEVDRTRPRSKLLDTARQTIGTCLSARQRLVFPDVMPSGTIRVLDGTTAEDVTWSGREWTLDAWQVRVVAACAGPRCVAVPEPVLTPLK